MVTLSAFEIHHIVGELQELVGAKIEKVFQQKKPLDDFLFQLHKPGSGKAYIYTSLPGTICQSSFKPVFPDIPPAFCSALRRKISNARIQAIEQHDFERIIKITLSTKHGDCILLFELFSSGNIILLGGNNKILSVLHPKVYSTERQLLPAKIYAFPKSQTNPFKLYLDTFIDLVMRSKKDSLVTFLAVDCSLGGTYAEEILAIANVDKETDPQKSSKEESTKVFEALKKLLEEKTSPFQFGEDKVSPVPLVSKEGKKYEGTFTNLVADLALAELEEAEQKTASKDKDASLSKFDKVLKSQEHQLKGLKISEKENQEKGELIYTNYQEVQEVLNKISKLRKTESWKDIKEELKDNPLVENVDEHNGKVTINLE